MPGNYPPAIVGTDRDIGQWPIVGLMLEHRSTPDRQSTIKQIDGTASRFGQKMNPRRPDLIGTSMPQRSLIQNVMIAWHDDHGNSARSQRAEGLAHDLIAETSMIKQIARHQQDIRFGDSRRIGKGVSRANTDIAMVGSVAFDVADMDIRGVKDSNLFA
jgi:hypothetical protein